jgi:hypothetical protein
MSAIVSHEGESTYTPRNAEIDQLADSIAVHAARVDAATHELLTEIRRFDDLGGWAWQGAKSCVDWLCWRVGLVPVTAAEKVRVARKLGELPLIDAAFAAGALSYCKVRAMARVASAATEARLLEMAQHATGAQLEKICRGFRRVQRAAALDDEARRKAAEPDRYVRQRHTPDGLVRIEVQLLPDEAELVWQALADVRAELVADAKVAAHQGTQSEVASAAAAVAEEHAASDACPCLQDGPDSAECAAVECSDMREVAAAPLTASHEPADTQAPDHPPVESPQHSAECPVDPADPLPVLFAPEPDEPRPRGTWARCEQTGELMYYGSDPPDVWPEDDEPSLEDGEAALQERARKQLPSRGEWAARRRGEVLPGLADALVTLAERALSVPPAVGADGKRRARRRGQRPLLLIHLSEDRLAQALAAVDDAPSDEAAPDAARGAAASAALQPARPVPFVAELHGGAWLRGETLLRLACDCGVAVVKTDAEGAVLDVGRRRRTIPPAIQRALLVRDGHCQFPGCTAEADETHHIDHWTQGGETRLDNLHLACKFHHTALHEGGFSVSRAEDGFLTFRDPFGRIIEAAPSAAPWASSGAETALEALAAEQQDGGLVIDRTTSLPHWDGTAPDIGAAVSGLWWRQEHGGGAAGAGASAGDSEHRA